MQLEHGKSEHGQLVPKQDSLETHSSRIVDRTNGWGGKSLVELKAAHKRFRLGDFHAEGEVKYAEMAGMNLLDAEKELEKLREAGIHEGANYKRQEARKREAEAELSVIPPEAHMTELDVALKKGYEAASNQLRNRERELGERRAAKDPEVHAMTREVRRLRDEQDNRKCEKTLMVAAALELPAAEHLLKDGNQIDDVVYRRNETQQLEAWRVLYATDIHGGGTGYHAILRKEQGGEMKSVGIDELSRYYLTSEQVQALLQPAEKGATRASLSEGRAPKALLAGALEDGRASQSRALTGPLGDRSDSGTTLALRREVKSPVTLKSWLRSWWKSLWK